MRLRTVLCASTSRMGTPACQIGIGDGARLRSLLCPTSSAAYGWRRGCRAGAIELERALRERVATGFGVDGHQVPPGPKTSSRTDAGTVKAMTVGFGSSCPSTGSWTTSAAPPPVRSTSTNTRRWNRSRRRHRIDEGVALGEALGARVGRHLSGGRVERRPERDRPVRMSRTSPTAMDRPRCRRRCRRGSETRARCRRSAAPPRPSLRSVARGARGGASRRRPVDGPSARSRNGRSRCRIGQIALEAAMVLICTETVPGRQPLGWSR